MPLNLSIDPDSVKGFMHADEGARLFELAGISASLGPCLEIGSYCGKSALYLGSGVKAQGGLLYTLDHHRGSEEHQAGEEYHDPGLFDARINQMDTLPELRRTLFRSGLEDCVVPIVGSSAQVGRAWQTPLSLLFIDGGHSHSAALTDYQTWVRHILPGGFLIIHDLFPDPADGGQAPYDIYQLAQATGQFDTWETVRTLGTLRRR